LFIDEVTYLMDVTPAIIGTIQKAWDQWLSQSNVFLALCGSQMGLMQKKILSYDAPLYGRATVQMKLEPLRFGATHNYFPHYDAHERVTAYAIWGGIPAYWERQEQKLSVLENLRMLLNPASSWMLDEPRLLLQDFVNDPHNYVGVMRAIAKGTHSFSKIGQQTGLSPDTRPNISACCATPALWNGARRSPTIRLIPVAAVTSSPTPIYAFTTAFWPLFIQNWL